MRFDTVAKAAGGSSPIGYSTADDLTLKSDPAEGRSSRDAAAVKRSLIVFCASLFAVSQAAAERFSWQLSGGYRQTDVGDVLESGTSSLSATYYPRPVDDSNGPYALAVFLNRSSAVGVNLSREKQVQAHVVGPVLANGVAFPDSDLRTRISAYSFSGRHVWPSTGWYLGGEFARDDVEQDEFSSETDDYGVVAGKYLGSRTTLALSLGSTTRTTPVGEVMCVPLSYCNVQLGSEYRSETADVSVRHVGDVGRLAYSVSATGLSGRSTSRVILPRVPASAPPGLADSLAELVESEASRPSARRRGYLVVGELFPTMALGVAISYLSVDNEAQEESVGNDSVGISAEWFFRRNVAVYVTARRTRIDDPIGPITDKSDSVSVRLLGRL